MSAVSAFPAPRVPFASVVPSIGRGQLASPATARPFFSRIATGLGDAGDSPRLTVVRAKQDGCLFPKAVRTIVRLRKKDHAERQEEEAILDLYKTALGMV